MVLDSQAFAASDARTDYKLAALSTIMLRSVPEPSECSVVLGLQAFAALAARAGCMLDALSLSLLLGGRTSTLRLVAGLRIMLSLLLCSRKLATCWMLS